MAAPSKAPDRNLALELVRVTEAAAMAAGRWVGRGDKNGADGVAVNAMRIMISTIAMNGTVVIGEGEKDQAPMLFNGEQVGDGQGPEVDVAVDPLEGTRLTALGMPNAITTVALAERGTMYFPGAAVYMDKIATGPESADAVSIDASPTDNVRAVANAKGVSVSEVSVVVLDRPRHEALVEELREAGAKVMLITDGDVAPAIAAAQPGTGVDVLMGIGGTPEGVLSAAALKCVGGAIQGRGKARGTARPGRGSGCPRASTRHGPRTARVGGCPRSPHSCRRDPGQALAADGRRAPDPRRRRLRPRPRADDRRPRGQPERVLRRHRRHDRRTPARRPLHA